MNQSILLPVLYAGLAGTVLALIVATITNRWSLRVFFLLALRLAIGWHFLFEGLYKVNSYYTGPTDTSRPFTSEPYFRAATGPLGPIMRKQFSDPAAEIAKKVERPKPTISPEEFDKLSAEEQAAECPPAVAEMLDKFAETAPGTVEAMKAAAQKEIDAANKTEKDELAKISETEAAGLKAATDALEKKKKQIAERYKTAGKDTATKILEVSLKEPSEVAQAVSAFELDRQLIVDTARDARVEAQKKAKLARDTAAKKAALYAGGDAMVVAAKATYARWVYGVDARDCKVPGISGDVALTAPQRLQHLDWLRAQVKAADDRTQTGLGNGYGTDVKRRAQWNTDLITAESDLARDADAFIADLQKSLNNGKDVKKEPVETRGKQLDKFTMWFLVVVGACIMGGLLTRLACLAAAGFLVMTYLTFPAFPWLPKPPDTEGNPLFVNKNVIEALALLVLACYPTGRWLGLDALVLRPFCRYKSERPA